MVRGHDDDFEVDERFRIGEEFLEEVTAPLGPDVGPTEPVFVLRGQDILAPELVRLWAAEASWVLGYDHPKVRGARAIADAMEAWPIRKYPD